MEHDKAHWPTVDPVGAGLRARCPRCGEGRLFSGFLTIGDECGNCRLDYSFADAGDGPAVFVILIIGFVVVALALWMEVSYSPPIWVQLTLWTPVAIVLCLASLRPLKGLMVAVQYKNKAAEGRLDEGR